MIFPERVKPACFREFPDAGFEWIRLEDDRGVLGHAALGAHPDWLELHVGLTRVNRAVLADDLERLRHWARREGFRAIRGRAPAGASRLPALARACGYACRTQREHGRDYDLVELEV